MKHLYADLHTIFKPTPIYRPPVTLPSGPPYIRPMTISAIRTLTCYSYEVNWYSDIVEIKLTKLTTDKALRLSYPQFPQNSAFKRYQAFIQQWRPYPPHRKRYFRTNDDALIDAFINYPYTQKTNPEFMRIKTLYPEYFV